MSRSALAEASSSGSLLSLRNMVYVTFNIAGGRSQTNQGELI